VEYFIDNRRLFGEKSFGEVYFKDNEKFLDKLYSKKEICFDGNKVINIRFEFMKNIIKCIRIHTINEIFDRATKRYYNNFPKVEFEAGFNSVEKYYNSFIPTVEFNSIDMVKYLSEHNDSSFEKKQYKAI